MYFFIAFILLYYLNPVKIPYTAKKIIRLVAQVPKNLLYFIKLFFAYGQNRTKKSKKMKNTFHRFFMTTNISVLSIKRMENSVIMYKKSGGVCVK